MANLTKKNLLLKNIEKKDKLTKDDFNQIDFINLHAHSTYSLQDAVGKVEDHFIKTIDAGHCGCCITDHGSYASFIDLYNLKTNKIGSSKVQERFERTGKEEHPVVMGAELYIIDDRHIKLLENFAEKDDITSIEKHLLKMKVNPQWKDMFFEKPSKSKTVKKTKIPGTVLLEALKSQKGEELRKSVDEFNLSTFRCTSYKYNHITLMAKNSIGHSNLCHLTSIGSLPENFYSRPRVRFTDLLENKEGIIVTSGCFVGMIPQAIHRKTEMEEEYFQIFKQEFGDDFYIEIHLTDVSYQWDKNLQEHVKTVEINPMIKVNDRLIELCAKYDMQDNIYITQDSHMPNKSDKEIQDIVIMNDVGNKSNWHFKNIYYIQEVQEMYEAMRIYFPLYTNEQFVNWCFNTIGVLEKCRDAKIDMSLKFVRPNYENHPVNNPFSLKTVKGEDFEELEGEDRVRLYISQDNKKNKLRAKLPLSSKFFNSQENTSKEIDAIQTAKNIEKNLATEKRIMEIFEYQDYYTQKAKYFYDSEYDLQTLIRVAVSLGKIDFDDERYRRAFFSDLNIIQFNGIIALSDYFMVFEEISRLVVWLDEFKGPGRGSAAGCLVSYAIDITDIDPIKYDLLMERFLLPERVGVINFEIDGYPLTTKEYKDEDFTLQINKLQQLKKILEGKSIPEDEMFYFERNFQIVDYIWELREKGLKNLENTNNSAILYSLGICNKPKKGITKSDPSMPDIDYDSSCRDLINFYLLEVHGVKKACYIGTYGSLKAKSAMKDVLRVRRVNGVIMSSEAVNKLTKEFDKVKLSEKDMSKGELYVFKLVVEQNETLSNFFTQHKSIKDDCENILGTYKNMGTHAAGVILSPTEISRIIPLTWDKKKGGYRTQICKEEVEQVGLIKLDNLGLKTAEDLRDCARLIKKRHGKNYFTNWEQILDNLPKEVGEGYIRCDTTSVFQMNTTVSIDLLKNVKVMNDPVRDVAAYTSSLRPGPMSANVHRDLVDTINGFKEETYLDEQLKPFLKDTYGHLIYQEQVIKICIEIGGFTKFEADKIRKAMGKKKFKIIDKYETQFVEYAVTNKNISSDIAREIWANMAAFAEYGFNKSHAICYSAVSCICMYFKTQYPLEWMAACLSRVSRSDSDSDKKNFKRYYREWKSYLKNPDINKSGREYEIVDNSIYMPIYSSKAIKKDTALKIMKLREFKDFDNLVLKMKVNDLGRKDIVEALVYSGACDSFLPDIKELKSKISTDFESIKDQLELVNGLAKMFKGIDFNLEGLSDNEASDLLGIINSKEKEDLSQNIIDSGILDISINKFQFRKYLIQKYYSQIKGLTIKKAILDKLKEEKEDTSLNKLALLETRSVDAMNLRNPDLYNKWSGYTNKGVNKAVKETLSAKEKEEYLDLEKELILMHDKSILNKELEYLNFTSFDFFKMYGDEVKKAEERRQMKVYKLSEVTKMAANIASKAKELKFSIRKILSEKNQDLISIRENSFVILTIMSHLQDNFGKWQLRDVVGEIKDMLEDSDPIQKIYYQLALENTLHENKDLKLDKKTFSKFNIPKKTKVFLHKKHSYILSELVKSKIGITDANRDRYINFPIVDLVNLLKLAHIVKNNNKTIRLNLITENGLEDISKKLRLSKPGNTEDVLKILSEIGISGGIGYDLFEAQLDKKRLSSKLNQVGIYSISEQEKKLLTKSFMVFGSLFKAEKKIFKREFSNYKGVTKEMNLLLSDDDDQLTVNIKNYDKLSLYRVSREVSFEDTVEDFKPVIYPVQIAMNLGREEAYKLRLVNDQKSNIVFLEDYL